MAWLRGLKTTYYLRALGATSAEKSTINTGALNAVNQHQLKLLSLLLKWLRKKPEAQVEEDGFTHSSSSTNGVFNRQSRL